DVRLVVDDERAAAVAAEEVEATVQEDPVVREGEPELRPRALRACRKLRAAVCGRERGDALHLLVGRERVPLADEVDAALGPLEQPVDRVADLGRRKAARALTRPASLTHPGDALGVVTVRTALEQRECGVRQPADTVKRGRRDV